jgi:3-demethylubiquinone-9 3-methyltransferase
MYKFNEAISLSVDSADQAEIDMLWEKLSAVGRRIGFQMRMAQGQIRVVVADRPHCVAETDGRSHRAGHVGRLGA